MSVKVYAQNLLNQMINADHGDKVMLTFDSVKEREVFRTTLYRERKELSKHLPHTAPQITVKQVSSEEGIFLVIEKDTTIKPFSGRAYLIKANRDAAEQIQELDLAKLNNLQRKVKEMDNVAKSKKPAEPSLLRVINQMREDGAIKNPRYKEMPADIIATMIVDGAIQMDDLEEETAE